MLADHCLSETAMGILAENTLSSESFEEEVDAAGYYYVATEGEMLQQILRARHGIPYRHREHFVSVYRST